MKKKKFRSAVLQIFKPLEYLLEVSYSNYNTKTIWIIGPPRSGTTLLYKLLAKNYSFTYVSNFAARFAEIPLLSTLYSSLIYKKKENDDLNFQYGQTNGPLGPHEAGKLWYRWFPGGKDIYITEDFWEEKSLNNFRNVISALCSINKHPGLFKNTYNSMRIAAICKVFPDAVFLVCDRSPTDIAQSILNARIKINNDKNEWWALPPKEFEQIKSHPYWDQVVEQVYYIYQQIEHDSKIQADNFLSVSYKNLCINSEQELKNIEAFLTDKNIDVIKTNKEDINKRNIVYSTGQKVSDKDYNRIQKKVNELWNGKK